MTVTTPHRHSSFFTFSTKTTVREAHPQETEFHDAPCWLNVRLTKAVSCFCRPLNSNHPPSRNYRTLPAGTRFPSLSLITLDADTQGWVGKIGSYSYLMVKCGCCDGAADIRTA
jgi:hypothetical protein